jgi:hypothetical protein
MSSQENSEYHERMGLQTNPETLLAMLPGEIRKDTLVITPENSETELDIIYARKNRPDEFRDWKAYETWKEVMRNSRDEDHFLPRNFAQVYSTNFIAIRDGLLSRDDQIILSARFEKKSKYEVYLSFIARNPAKEFKNLGAEVYQNAVKVLSGKGFKFITAFPIAGNEKVRKFWISQGHVPISKVKPEKQAAFHVSREDGRNYTVHFLDKKVQDDFLSNPQEQNYT